MEIIEFIKQPWQWYVSGPLIAFVMLLLLKTGKSFGVSSTLRSWCAIGGAGKHCEFFDFNWKGQLWNIVFVFGAIIGGYLASTFLQYSNENLQISSATIEDLQALNISVDGIAPVSLFSWESLFTLQGSVVMVLGGFLVGFGARWAGGCTSGHAISGLSDLQFPSLLAVIGFFIGGLIMTYLLFPLIF